MNRFLWLLAMLLPSGALLADELPVKPEGAENCVSLSRIDHTRIVDDRTILFYMKGSDIYVNRLPRRCPGLKRADSYLYKTSLTQLCNVDTITVLQRFGGPGFTPGPSCGLGFYEPITAEGVEAMLAEPAEVRPEAVTPEVEKPTE